MRILIAEDDAATLGYISRGLRELGHDPVTAATGQDALLIANSVAFDAIVLDRMLPAPDGMAILRALRGGGNAVPVLMLTARSRVEDRVEGLHAGADDYLVKPFALSELSARLEALARRPAGMQAPTEIIVGDIVIDLIRREVRRAGRRIDLQAREFALLVELMRHAGGIVTRTMLLERVWRFHFDPRTNIVETHISRLRSKLNAGADHDAIQTVRGAGYRIDAGG